MRHLQFRLWFILLHHRVGHYSSLNLTSGGLGHVVGEVELDEY